MFNINGDLNEDSSYAFNSYGIISDFIFIMHIRKGKSSNESQWKLENH